MEEMLKKICVFRDRHSNDISLETEKKVYLGSGFYCTCAGFTAMEDARNDCDWAVALLVGVFGEDAKFMRIYPRKEGLKKFPLGFLMLAQSLYRERLKQNNCEDNIDQLVKSLPAYLSDRALDLGGARHTFSRENHLKRSTNKLQRTGKKVAGPSTISSSVSSNSQSPLNLKEKESAKLKDAVQNNNNTHAM